MLQYSTSNIQVCSAGRMLRGGGYSRNSVGICAIRTLRVSRHLQVCTPGNHTDFELIECQPRAKPLSVPGPRSSSWCPGALGLGLLRAYHTRVRAFGGLALSRESTSVRGWRLSSASSCGHAPGPHGFQSPLRLAEQCNLKGPWSPDRVTTHYTGFPYKPWQAC